MKRKTLCLAVAAVALIASVPALAEEEEILAPAAAMETQDACLDYTPVEGSEAQPALLLDPADMEPVAPGCKTCKDQPFCKCTYNGMRRVSCDPCCYVNDIGFQTCLS